MIKKLTASYESGGIFTIAQHYKESIKEKKTVQIHQNPFKSDCIWNKSTIMASIDSNQYQLKQMRLEKDNYN